MSVNAHNFTMISWSCLTFVKHKGKYNRGAVWKWQKGKWGGKTKKDKEMDMGRKSEKGRKKENNRPKTTYTKLQPHLGCSGPELKPIYQHQPKQIPSQPTPPQFSTTKLLIRTTLLPKHRRIEWWMKSVIEKRNKKDLMETSNLTHTLTMS